MSPTRCQLFRLTPAQQAHMDAQNMVLSFHADERIPVGQPVPIPSWSSLPEGLKVCPYIEPTPIPTTFRQFKVKGRGNRRRMYEMQPDVTKGPDRVANGVSRDRHEAALADVAFPDAMQDWTEGFQVTNRP